MITRKQLIKKYLDFFEGKKHKVIPSAPLVPENDPTVLFTTAGMHPLVPYLLGQPHPLGKRIVNNQKCIRTVDIEEVGDSTHHTFFEMLGNWSLGDYFKKEAIEMSFEFLTSSKWLNLSVEKLAVTCFKGDKDAPRDTEARDIWESLGIPEKKIAFLPKSENFWGPAGQTGPCGPCTEMFYWRGKEKVPKAFDPKNKNWVEIWNDVFMEYNKKADKTYEKLTMQNVDTGLGVERVIAVLNNLEDNYLTDSFKPIIQQIEEVSKKKYENNKKVMRIIADHIKASIFIIADGITPSNTDQGYVLRRLIRRAVRQGRILNIKNFTEKIADPVLRIYEDYPELKENKEKIMNELKKEEEKFLLTLEKGLNKFQKITKNKKEINCKDAFLLYQSYGFPIEMTKELAEEKRIKIDEEGFKKECEVHQEISRTATEGRFKSGLADNSEATTKLHTATHLLMAALRIILKDENIMQKGSNITPERLRLDFNFNRKLTKEELEKIEDLVNSRIQGSCEITSEEMTPQQAREKGAIGVFDGKYGGKVTVYSIEDFSKEICAGPHVKNTCELGHFKIKKEESSSSGVRRIKAVLE
jgi:alanyl-tRNA synthetase